MTLPAKHTTMLGAACVNRATDCTSVRCSKTSVTLTAWNLLLARLFASTTWYPTIEKVGAGRGIAVVSATDLIHRCYTQLQVAMIPRKSPKNLFMWSLAPQAQQLKLGMGLLEQMRARAVFNRHSKFGYWTAHRASESQGQGTEELQCDLPFWTVGQTLHCALKNCWNSLVWKKGKRVFDDNDLWEQSHRDSGC